MAPETKFTLIDALGKASVVAVPKIIYGTSGADEIINENSDYRIFGCGGSDTIENFGGNGTIQSGKGEDYIYKEVP